jgi:hypothetical protein
MQGCGIIARDNAPPSDAGRKRRAPMPLVKPVDGEDAPPEARADGDDVHVTCR